MNEQEHNVEHALQKSLNERIDKFFSNDWPHAQQVIGQVKGRLDILLVLLSIFGTVITAVLVKSLF